MNLHIITKIILKEWFRSLLGALIILVLLITVGDIINGFMRGYSASVVMLEYLLKLPDLMSKVLPICALLATLFSFNKLKNHSELMAMLSAGYSSYKLYRVVILSSLIIACIQFINIGYVKPHSNKIKRQEFEKSQKNESKYLARSKYGDSGLLWYKSQSYFTSFDFFDEKKKELRNISLYLQSKNGLLEKFYKASSAIYTDEGFWQFNNVKEVSNLSSNGFPHIQTYPELKIDLEEKPEDFNQFKSDITTLNFVDLYRFISSLDKSGINTSEYTIMLLEPIVLSIICILFALFPLSTIFTPNRRASSFGKSVLLTLSFSIVFWLIYSYLSSMATSGKLSPYVALMSSPIMFFLYICYVFRKNRKL
jgi:LPS export ABC transporter permease LptG